LEIETKHWAPADALRNNMDAAEYKHIQPGVARIVASAPQNRTLSAMRDSLLPNLRELRLEGRADPASSLLKEVGDEQFATS
jgi:hypothetical protein